MSQIVEIVRHKWRILRWRVVEAWPTLPVRRHHILVGRCTLQQLVIGQRLQQKALVLHRIRVELTFESVRVEIA